MPSIKRALDVVSHNLVVRFGFGAILSRQRALSVYPTLIDMLDLPEGSRVLDSGCGYGGLVRGIRQRQIGSVSMLGSLDMDGHNIQQARKGAKRIRERYGGVHTLSTRADAMYPPFASGSFDGVIDSWLLPHAAYRDYKNELGDHMLMLASYLRITKPGGRILLHPAEPRFINHPFCSRAEVAIRASIEIFSDRLSVEYKQKRDIKTIVLTKLESS